MSVHIPPEISEYLAKFPKQKSDFLLQLYLEIAHWVPEAESYVAYAMPAYKYRGKPLVYVGIWANHLGFYPKAHAMKVFEAQFGSYGYSKGALQLPYDRALPFDLLKSMVMLNVEEIDQSLDSKKSKKQADTKK
jgi:uncharacterized protein YdhG (YjbR/CyaY superfamily)